MRRKDREQSREFALNTADRCEYAVLSMTMPDGRPYCVPLSMVRDGDCLYFHCALQGQKLEALRKEPRVCVCCVTDTRTVPERFTMAYASALLTGTAEEVTDTGEKRRALELLCRRYAPENPAGVGPAIASDLSRTGVWKILLSAVTGKANLI